jgi:hypothetical protein
MTFLEYIIERKLGEPSSRGGDGTYWPCPHCGSDRFHTMPHRYGCKDRFRCWKCGWWGDEHDFLIETRRGTSYAQRCRLLADLRTEYDRQQAKVKRSAAELESESPSPLRGPGRQAVVDAYGRDPAGDAFCPESEAAIAELLEYMEGAPTEEAMMAALELCERVLSLCGAYRLHPLGLAERIEYERWIRDRKQQMKRSHPIPKRVHPVPKSGK